MLRVGSSYTNSRWQEIAGLTLEENLGEGWTKAIVPEDRKDVFTEWQACAQEKRQFSREFRLCQPQGKVRWVHARTAALRTDNGEPQGYVGTGRGHQRTPGNRPDKG